MTIIDQVVELLKESPKGLSAGDIERASNLTRMQVRSAIGSLQRKDIIISKKTGNVPNGPTTYFGRGLVWKKTVYRLVELPRD